MALLRIAILLVDLPVFFLSHDGTLVINPLLLQDNLSMYVSHLLFILVLILEPVYYLLYVILAHLGWAHCLEFNRCVEGHINLLMVWVLGVLSLVRQLFNLVRYHLLEVWVIGPLWLELFVYNLEGV